MAALLLAPPFTERGAVVGLVLLGPTDRVLVAVTVEQAQRRLFLARPSHTQAAAVVALALPRQGRLAVLVGVGLVGLVPRRLVATAQSIWAAVVALVVKAPVAQKATAAPVARELSFCLFLRQERQCSPAA